MKFLRFGTWLVALLLVGFGMASCTEIFGGDDDDSDEDDEVSVTNEVLPDDMVGTWQFDGFRLTLKKHGTGVYVRTESNATSKASVKGLHALRRVATVKSQYKPHNMTYIWSSAKKLLRCNIEGLGLVEFDVVEHNTDVLKLGYNTNNGMRYDAGKRVADDSGNTEVEGITQEKILGDWYIGTRKYITFDKKEFKLYLSSQTMTGKYRMGSKGSIEVSIAGSPWVEMFRIVSVSGNAMQMQMLVEEKWETIELIRKVDQSVKVDISLLYGKTWTYRDTDGQLMLTFNSDGTGKAVSIDEDGRYTESFTFTFDGMNKLLMTNGGEKAVWTILSLSDRSVTMLIEDEDGENYTMTFRA